MKIKGSLWLYILFSLYTLNSVKQKQELNKLPSFSRPSAAAAPWGKMVLTKIPMWPRAESCPPTILNPSPWKSYILMNVTHDIPFSKDIIFVLWCYDYPLLIEHHCDTSVETHRKLKNLRIITQWKDFQLSFAEVISTNRT